MIMKRGKLLLIPALLACFPLVGCSASGEYTVTVRDNSEIVKEMPHKVGEKPSYKFKPGDGVIFRVSIVTDVDTIVTLNDTRIYNTKEVFGDEPDEKSLLTYAFVMPKKDCVIDISLRGGW